MSSFPKQRVAIITFVYCFAVAIICGTWSPDGNFGRSSGFALELQPVLGEPEDGSSISSSYGALTVGARKLTEAKAETDPSEERKVSSDSIFSLEITEDDHVVLDLRSTLPRLYHSPEFFAMNYNDMAKNLRIYLYPASQNYNFTQYEYGMNPSEMVSELGVETSSTADTFFNLLVESKRFVTDDADGAHLYFLPISIDRVWAAVGPAKVGEHLRHYLQWLRNTYKLWDLSLGADHFYFSSHAYDPINHRNNLELTKNAIQVASSPLRRNQNFFPHKDISLPSYKSQHIAEVQNLVGASQRPKLVFVSSPPEDIDPIVASVIQKWTSDSDFHVESADQPSPPFEKLLSSRFCVSVSPQAMLNVVDSLRLGCVPVLIADSIIYDLPFQDVLNWKEFSVVLGVKESPNLKTLLSSISTDEYRKMQYLGHQASKHMEWNDPPKPWDAFHMTLHELWVRRHSIKYARRNEDSPSQPQR